MTTNVTVYPSAQFFPTSIPELSPSTVNTPPVFGGGSVTDDSDASYLEIGGWQDTTGSNRLEPVACDFSVPASQNPSALLIQMRAKTPSQTTPDMATSSITRFVWFTIHRVADDVSIDSQSSRGEPLTPLILAQQTTPAWFTWYYEGYTPDLSDPTENGYWAEFAAHPQMHDALTGAGLRVTLFMQSVSEARMAWLDLYEVRLLVACNPTAAGHAPLCRQYPRDIHRKYPPSKARQYGPRRLGGSYQ